MPDRRRWIHLGRIVAALSLIAFGTICLLGYDPADAPGTAMVPPRDPPGNPGGPFGAVLAHFAMSWLGVGSFLAGYATAVAVSILLGRRRLAEPWGVVPGVACLVAVVACLAQRWWPDLAWSPAVGSGGYLGSVGLAFLLGQFGVAGFYLALITLAVVGLGLARELLSLPVREALRLTWGRATPAGPAGVPAPADLGPSLMIRAEVGSLARSLPPIPRPAPLVNQGPAARAVAPPSLDAPGSAVPSASAPGPTRLAPRPPEGSGHLPGVPANGAFVLPPISLLEPGKPAVPEHQSKIHERALLLEKTLLEFGCQVRVVEISTGPVITMFEIELEAGLRVAKINSVANDLAITLAVPNVRIVSPIPNKTTVGIEVPNEGRTTVTLAEVIQGVGGHLGKFRIPLFLGRDVKGNPLAFDMADMPHLLIAGRTGTGKSVCINAMILSILMTRRPDEVKLILIDPKQVELAQFKRIPHLMNPVVTDMKKAEALLAWACDKMDERYNLLARAGVRNIAGYNQLSADELYNRLAPEDDEEWERIPKFLEYIVIVVDEMADLVMQVGKEVETQIIRLAQKARAAGIHLILATQKPTVDVITGLIKSNLPARIAFQVSSRNDSRVVLDEMGAEKLLGNGDMLFLVPGTSHLVRAKGTFASDQDLARVCDYLAQYPQEFSRELIQYSMGGGAGGGARSAEAIKARDELYEQAIEIVIREGRGSTSLLQRSLGIGYGRAGKLIDYMAEDGIVGGFVRQGQAREVLLSLEDWENLKGGGDAT